MQSDISRRTAGPVTSATIAAASARATLAAGATLASRFTLAVTMTLVPFASARATPPTEATIETAFDVAHRALQMASSEFGRVEFERDVSIDAGAGGGERVVKGAPYCAEAVHETIQWLPDPGGAAANRIVRLNTTRLCRDGEGRTRQEVERGGRRFVYLRDPAAREGWVLDPERKTARRLAGTALSLDAAADAAVWRDYAEQMREWARATADAARARARTGTAGAAPTPPTPAAPQILPTPATAAAPLVPRVPPVPAAPPVPAMITRVERAGPGESEVTVTRLGRDGSRWDAPLLPPAVQWRATSLAPRGQGVTTVLSPRDFDGVRAHGERTTWTIEAGRVGNERPIQILREVWTAPELLLTVSSRDFDPRSGEVNYRLKNLKRGEPDANLMRVPVDFTRQDRGGPGGGAPGGGASAPRG